MKNYTDHISTTVEKRLERHNDGWNPSNKHGIPWQMKYYKSFETKTEAIKWENFIKRQKSRQFIEKLIDSDSFN